MKVSELIRKKKEGKMKMTEENLELLRDTIQEIRYIRQRINDLEDTLKLILATEKEREDDSI